MPLLTYEQRKEEYEVNPDFKEYVDKYCNHYEHSCTVETALTHRLVVEVCIAYRSRRLTSKPS